MDSGAVKIFENAKIRSVWDDKSEEWYFSVVDVVAALTGLEYQGARNYWKVTRKRLLDEGNETVTNCNRLKFVAQTLIIFKKIERKYFRQFFSAN